MTACDRGRVSAYYDGELPAAERLEMKVHLAACTSCARLLAEYQAIGASIRAMPDHAPPAVIRARVFSRAVPARRVGQSGRRVGQSGRLGAAVGFGALAAAVLLVVAIAAVYSQFAGRSSPIAQAPTRAAAPAGAPATVAGRPQPTVPPAAGSEQAAAKPPISTPAVPAAPQAVTTRPTGGAAPAGGPTLATPSGGKPAEGNPATRPAEASPVTRPAETNPASKPAETSPTPAGPAPSAIAIAQASASPTSGGIRLLDEPAATVTPTLAAASPITVTGIISEVLGGYQLTLRADDGIEWRVSLTNTEQITRTDGLAVSQADLRPGLRVGVSGRQTGSARHILARALTVIASAAPQR